MQGMIMNINLTSNSNEHQSTHPLTLPFPSFQPAPLLNTLSFNYYNNSNYHYNNNIHPHHHHHLMPVSTTTTTNTTIHPYMTTNLSVNYKPEQVDYTDHKSLITGTAFGAVSSIGLNLGQRTYFSSDDATVINRLFSRSRSGVYSSLNQQPPRCQAEGCYSDLSLAKHYHRRHKVCEFHSKATIVFAAGLQQRFCQQCSRFHVLSEFDESKRSCRKRLADHNRRRRKPQPQKNKQVMIMSTSRNRRSMEGEKKFEFEFEFECSNLYQNQVPNFVVSQHDEQPNMSLLHHDDHTNLFSYTSIGDHHEQQLHHHQQQQHNHQETIFEVEFM